MRTLFAVSGTLVCLLTIIILVAWGIKTGIQALVPAHHIYLIVQDSDDHNRFVISARNSAWPYALVEFEVLSVPRDHYSTQTVMQGVDLARVSLFQLDGKPIVLDEHDPGYVQWQLICREVLIQMLREEKENKQPTEDAYSVGLFFNQNLV